ncbi:MAG: ribonuclease HII [Candidatus Omnitrophica bacterium]|nr:ribonuclease HII [Candidatus Omnitrophota bacterium]
MTKNWKRHNLKLKRFEQGLLPNKYIQVAGVDEAGRGPLAGPVVAAAVVLKKFSFTAKVFDSKKLSCLGRDSAFWEIVENAHIGLGVVKREVIDEKNILQATIRAMQKAVADLPVEPDYLLVDGRFRRKSFSYPYQDVVRGDQRCFSIACASIIAKVVRDNLMDYYDTLYPQYAFNRNRGYYSKDQLAAVKKYGLSPIHRRSFQPLCAENANQ